MIVDYISENSPKPKNTVLLDELGVAYDDAKPRNYVNDYIIDYGGIVTISNLAGNKKAQKVHSMFKNLTDDNEKIQQFNRIFEQKDDGEYLDNLIGLTHSIKYLPEEKGPELYNQMYNLNIPSIDIALVENVKNFVYKFDSEDLLNGIIARANKDVKCVIAREIRSFPENLKHQLFETLSLESSNTIKKYLARNINQYYKNIANRINIYDNLMQNADTYANIALINSLNWIGKSQRDARFERFYNQNDVVATCALARNIELFEEDPECQKKWVDKLLEHDDVRVKRALCESVKFMPAELQTKVFEKLLDVQDMNAKEFLAETVISIPEYYRKKEWLIKLLDGADNSVRRAVAFNLNSIKYPEVKKEWTAIILDGADASVKRIIESQNP